MTKGPFRGSAAVAAGLVTEGALRGPGYLRVFRDVYVPAGSTLDLRTRSAAASLLVSSHGALAGYSAAELLGAECAPADAPAEVFRPRGTIRAQPGLVVHRGTLAERDVRAVGAVRVTSAARTAYDVARWSALVEAVVAVDALARVAGVEPRELLVLRDRYLGARGSRQVPRVVALSDPRAESPMETRLRLALVLHGLPPPSVQHPVRDENAEVVARLDLAYPDARLGIEYDGAQHRTQRRAMRDMDRQAVLTSLGWRVLRFTAADVLDWPTTVAARVRRATAAPTTVTSRSR